MILGLSLQNERNLVQINQICLRASVMFSGENCLRTAQNSVESKKVWSALQTCHHVAERETKRGTERQREGLWDNECKEYVWRRKVSERNISSLLISQLPFLAALLFSALTFSAPSC